MRRLVAAAAVLSVIAVVVGGGAFAPGQLSASSGAPVPAPVLDRPIAAGAGEVRLDAGLGAVRDLDGGTIAVELRAGAPAGDGTLLRAYDRDAPDREIAVSMVRGTLRFLVRDGKDVLADVSTRTRYADGAAHTVLVSSAPGGTRFFVDGSRVRDAGDGGFFGDVEGLDALVAGGSGEAGRFTGELGRVTVYPVAVGGAQAASLHPPEVSREYARLTGLVNDDRHVTWVFTGDSVTQRSNHMNGARDYTQLFAERIRWELGRSSDYIVNTAVSGSMMDDVLDGFEVRVAALHPDVVSVMMGANDALNGPGGRGEFRERLTELVRRIREVGAVPLLQTPNPIGLEGDPKRADLPAYSTVVREVAREHGVILVDHGEIWRSWPDEVVDARLDDPLHPNGAGHRMMARALFERLRLFDPESAVCSLPV